MPELVSVAEVAKRLGAGASTVRRWCTTLGVQKVGAYHVITPEDLKRIKDNIRRDPGRPPLKD